MSKNWSTGLFSFFDDMQIFLYGVLAPVPLMLNNSVELGGGKAVFGVNGESCAKPCFTAGCVGSDGIWCTNCVVFEIIPCVYIIWRGAVRSRFQIQGNLLGDIIACCCCYQCAVMQDARELKLNGALYRDAQRPTA